ncbi:MAG: D-glycero-beta-D-manno-heptose-7-phosphate kinase [Bryobacteraceae bacterium]|nr:D-glycero-beta-D-manno-heptose-7-phosphate kinase [Bryobacteraceae bacterium]
MTLGRRPAIFFDRDGVLNVDAGYLFRSDEVRWVPGAMAAVRRANDLGFLTVVVTNQSGVARGLYTEAEIVALHGWMQAQLGEAGAHIDAFYYCPHHPQGSEQAYRVDCDCRKPLPGMLLRAARELDIDLTASILIGDSPRDITAAEAAGATGYLFRDGDLSTFFNALLVDRLRRAKTVCVGDVMLDEFIYGDVNRISPEAPVPVLRTDRHRSMLGGAGNAVRNMAALGSQVTLLSVTGDDQSGSAVAELCKALPECDAVLLREPGRVTPTKTRFVAHSQQLLRADRESTAPVSEALLGQLLQGFSESLKYASAVLLSDYAKGVLSGSHASRFIALARDAGVPVVVDPKGTSFARYSGATVLKPNLRELAHAVDMPVDTPAQIEAAARHLAESAGVPWVLVTRGPDGMMLVPANGAAAAFQSLAREVYDVTGAGDTVAAVLTAALGAGLPIRAAVELANIAAGIVVGKTGTATVSLDEIKQHLRSAQRPAAESSAHDDQ